MVSFFRLLLLLLNQLWEQEVWYFLLKHTLRRSSWLLSWTTYWPNAHLITCFNFFMSSEYSGSSCCKKIWHFIHCWWGTFYKINFSPTWYAPYSFSYVIYRWFVASEGLEPCLVVINTTLNLILSPLLRYKTIKNFNFYNYHTLACYRSLTITSVISLVKEKDYTLQRINDISIKMNQTWWSSYLNFSFNNSKINIKYCF